MSGMLENVDIGGLHALVVGGSNILTRDILEYIDIGGFTPGL